MVRHLLRTAGGSIVLVLCLISLPGQAFAQAGSAGLGGAGILNDPFTFYYAIYLPNQQLQSMRPTPMDSINNAMVTRQYYAQSDRRGLVQPDFSLRRPELRSASSLFSSTGYGASRQALSVRSRSIKPGRDRPSLYYGRAAQYFPGLRDGQRPQCQCLLERRCVSARRQLHGTRWCRAVAAAWAGHGRHGWHGWWHGWWAWAAWAA